MVGMRGNYSFMDCVNGFSDNFKFLILICFNFENQVIMSKFEQMNNSIVLIMGVVETLFIFNNKETHREKPDLE